MSSAVGRESRPVCLRRVHETKLTRAVISRATESPGRRVAASPRRVVCRGELSVSPAPPLLWCAETSCPRHGVSELPAVFVASSRVYRAEGRRLILQTVAGLSSGRGGAAVGSRQRLGRGEGQLAAGGRCERSARVRHPGSGDFGETECVRYHYVINGSHKVISYIVWHVLELSSH